MPLLLDSLYINKVVPFTINKAFITYFIVQNKKEKIYLQQGGIPFRLFDLTLTFAKAFPAGRQTIKNKKGKTVDLTSRDYPRRLEIF